MEANSFDRTNIVIQAILRHIVVGEYFLTLKMIDRFIVFTQEYTAHLAVINQDFIWYTICIHQKSCLNLCGDSYDASLGFGLEAKTLPRGQNPAGAISNIYNTLSF